MSKSSPTPIVVADHARFGVRVTYDTNGDTVVSSIDCMEPPCARAVTQAGKLSALICLINGEGFDAFESLAKSHKRNVIWMLDDLAHEVLALTEMASDLDTYPANMEASHG
ncbi:hypothetical protein ABH944_002974 [Caballeronia udeis]|uniref:Uncharacterized protein n=1 Tax=Caballeronia udeis TaxID=1232866 RepID=A0ABW8MGR5_9BURK